MALRDCAQSVNDMVDEDVNALVDAYDSYKRTGMSDKEAITLAIEDIILTLGQERNDYMAMVNDQAPSVQQPAGRYEVGGILVNRDGSYRKNASGDISGAPAGVKTDQDITDIANIFVDFANHRLANAELSHRWYARSGAAVRRFAHGDEKLMENTVRLMAYFSQANSVGGNTTALISSLTQYARGQDEIFAGRFPKKTSKIIRGLLDAPHFDPSVPGVQDKIMSFYRNLHDEAFQKDQWPNDVTIDRWMYRVMGYAENQAGGSTSQYKFGKEVMRRATEKYNQSNGTSYKPREMQAILWTYARNSEKAGEALAAGKKFVLPRPSSFNTHLHRAAAHVPFETLPGDNTGQIPWIYNASPEVQNQYHQEAVELVTTPGGEDTILAQSTAALHQRQVSRGTFEGAVSPNTIASIVTDKGKGGHDTAIADLYAVTMQYIFSQKGVGWFRLDNRSKGPGVVVAEFKDRNPSLGDIQALRDATGKDFTVLNGTAVFVDFGGSGRSLKKFVNDVRSGLNNYPDFDKLGGIYQTRADSNYFGGATEETKYDDFDWQADPQGQALRNTIATRGSPDLAEWADDRRRAVAALQQDFTERQGTARVAEEVEGYRSSDSAESKPLAESLQQDLQVAQSQATGNLLLNSINAEMAATGSHSLIGKTITSPEEFATLGQVWRDPRWETMRYVFVDDNNKVVGQTGLSQRIPGSSSIFPEGIYEAAEGMAWVEEQMRAAGGTAVWLMRGPIS